MGWGWSHKFGKVSFLGYKSIFLIYMYIYSYIYMRTKINFNLYCFLFVRILQYVVGWIIDLHLTVSTNNTAVSDWVVRSVLLHSELILSYALAGEMDINVIHICFLGLILSSAHLVIFGNNRSSEDKL